MENEVYDVIDLVKKAYLRAKAARPQTEEDKKLVENLERLVRVRGMTMRDYYFQLFGDIVSLIDN